MNKKKIGIIAIVSVIIIGVGLGFNSIFSNFKYNENPNTTAEDEKVSDKTDKDENKNSKEDNQENEDNQEKDDSEKADAKKDEVKGDESKKDQTSQQVVATKPETSNPSTENKPNNETTSPSKPTEGQIPEQPKKQTVTIGISCKTAINSGLNQQPGFTHLPSSGTILSTMEVEFNDGDTVFDVLVKATRQKGIHMEYTGSGSSIYIEGINNLYEFDGGPESGWMYSVNGVYPNYGAGAYKLKSSDVIKWNYTCDLGADLGAKRN